MARCYRDESDPRTTELVGIVKEACLREGFIPTNIYLTGSRLFNLQSEKSDYDFLVTTKHGTGQIRIYDPCKIDIFVLNVEFLKCDIYSYREKNK